MKKEIGIFHVTLSCGCEGSWGRYDCEENDWDTWGNWGKVDISPRCRKQSHYEELLEKQEKQNGGEDR